MLTYGKLNIKNVCARARPAFRLLVLFYRSDYLNKPAKWLELVDFVCYKDMSRRGLTQKVRLANWLELVYFVCYRSMSRRGLTQKVINLQADTAYSTCVKMVNDAHSLGKILIIDFVEWWVVFLFCLFI